MKFIQEASDYFQCMVGHDKETGKFTVEETVFDIREESGFQYSYPKIADGFESIVEAEEWMKAKQQEQEDNEVNELYDSADLVRPF